MHTQTAHVTDLRIGRGTVATLLVAAAMSMSAIVFAEPAPADVLMIGVVLGIPVLGAGRFGPVTALNTAAWLVVVAAGLAAVPISSSAETALKHQLITLFLVAGAAALAAYVAADPVSRFRVVMTCYTASCLIATLAAVVGYFGILPGSYDLFTNYGRARGTFEDPNVLGAALCPAIAYTFWTTLRASPRRALLAAPVALILVGGVLISFSRGAWASAAMSVLVAAWLALVTTRRRADLVRYLVMSGLGLLALLTALVALSQIEKVQSSIAERATLDQSYDQGPEGRFGGQRKAVKLMLENPFGIGTHTFRTVYHTEEVHNVYLSTFLNAGWLGGLLYLASVLATVMMSMLGACRTGPLQAPFAILCASFLGLALEGLIIDTDHWRHFFIISALIWGLADAAQRTAGRFAGASS